MVVSSSSSSSSSNNGRATAHITGTYKRTLVEPICGTEYIAIYLCGTNGNCGYLYLYDMKNVKLVWKNLLDDVQFLKWDYEARKLVGVSSCDVFVIDVDSGKTHKICNLPENLDQEKGDLRVTYVKDVVYRHIIVGSNRRFPNIKDANIYTIRLPIVSIVATLSPTPANGMLQKDLCRVTYGVNQYGIWTYNRNVLYVAVMDEVTKFHDIIKIGLTTLDTTATTTTPTTTTSTITDNNAVPPSFVPLQRQESQVLEVPGSIMNMFRTSDEHFFMLVRETDTFFDSDDDEVGESDDNNNKNNNNNNKDDKCQDVKKPSKVNHHHTGFHSFKDSKRLVKMSTHTMVPGDYYDKIWSKQLVKMPTHTRLPSAYYDKNWYEYDHLNNILILKTAEEPKKVHEYHFSRKCSGLSTLPLGKVYDTPKGVYDVHYMIVNTLVDEKNQNITILCHPEKKDVTF
jgi:hypothetical protein